MKQLLSILIGALLAGGAVQAVAADQPTSQKEQSKDQAKKDKPQGKPSGTQRRTTIPET